MSNTNHVNMHTRVRIREGELDAFLEVAARFVGAVKAEPGALECSCYVDRDTNTVSWFEVFDGPEGFLGHLANEAGLEMQPKMAAAIEAFERLEIYGPVPEDVIAGLAEQGYPMVLTQEQYAGFVGRDAALA